MKELDSLFRSAIRIRDFDQKVCPLCKKPWSVFRSPQVCHWRKRRYLNTRWDLNNAILGCSVCNTEDVDVSHILEERGVDLEKTRIKSLSYDKVDKEQIRFELLVFLKDNYEDQHRHIITREAEIALGLR